MRNKTCLGKVKLYSKTILAIATPLIFSPLLFTSSEVDASRCGYTILVMAVYWITEVVPLAVTALLPLVMYPLLGVLPARVVCLQYLKDVNILFLGGLTVAVAVEHWNLHKRVALKVLTLVGAKPKWLLFGFMSTTAFLSMWISNVATTAMMVPIAQAVLDEMKEEDDNASTSSGSYTPPGKDETYRESDTIIHITEADQVKIEQCTGELGYKMRGNGTVYPPNNNLLQVATEEDGPVESTEALVNGSVHKKTDMTIMDMDSEISRRKENDNVYKGLCKALTLCICYSANIGGTATLTGTGPNLIMAGQFKTRYDDAPEVDFGSWMLFAFVGMVCYLMICWMWLQYLFLNLGFKDLFCCGTTTVNAKEIQGEAIIKKQYAALGKMSWAEKSVLTLFIIMALLWLTRDPGFANGWGYFFKPKFVSDATVAMTISFSMFLLPSRMPNFLKRKLPHLSDDPEVIASHTGPVPPLLTWKVLNEKMAWNVILLLGGGFAMALGAKQSGLSNLIGKELHPLANVSPVFASLICCTVIAALTQCTSNTATATVFLPILAEVSEVLGVNPLYLMLPATLTTSYAFMFPVSTPPNAISYSYGHLKMMDMVKAGFLLNILGLFVAMLSVQTMGGPAFSVFENCPDWLESEICKNETLSNDLMNSTIATLINSTVS